MPSFSTSTLEYNLIAKEFWFDRSDPTEELILIPMIPLREVLPLPAKARSRRRLFALNLVGSDKSRNTSKDRKRIWAAGARQLALHYFFTLFGIDCS
jgi:hypothetical protein